MPALALTSCVREQISRIFALLSFPAHLGCCPQTLFSCSPAHCVMVSLQFEIRDFLLLSVHLAQPSNACKENAKNAGNPLDSVPECIKRPASGVPGPAPSSCLLCNEKELNMPRFLPINCITASSPPTFSFLIHTNKHLSSDLPLPFWGNPESM